MNSLVASSHPLANVEQYPVNRMIRFRWDGHRASKCIEAISKQINNDISIYTGSHSALTKDISTWTKELDSLSPEAVSRNIKYYSRQLALLERQFIRKDLLKNFVESLYALGFTDARVQEIIDLTAQGKTLPSYAVNNKRVAKLFDSSSFPHNRQEAFKVSKALKFLSNPDLVGHRRVNLDAKITDATNELSKVNERGKVLFRVRDAFDKFLTDWKRTPSINHIFGMYDSEMLFRKKIIRYMNLDVPYFERMFADIQEKVSTFGLNKYFVVESLADDKEFMDAIKDYETYELKPYIADIRIITFTQQLSCALSNFLDLNLLDDTDLIRRIRVVIDFCVWIFEVDFSDNRSAYERMMSWAFDQLDKADRVESCGGSIEMLIGGSERHREFLKNK
jgi:hypothetical protein